MGTIELEQFSLREGVDRDQFLRLDEAAQAWAYRHRRGLVRRTTAMDGHGEVLVVTLFSGATEPPGEPIPALEAAIDTATYRRSRYVDLDSLTAAPA